MKTNTLRHAIQQSNSRSISTSFDLGAHRMNFGHGDYTDWVVTRPHRSTNHSKNIFFTQSRSLSRYKSVRHAADVSHADDYVNCRTASFITLFCS